jgi:hypothetical protein
MQRFVKQNTHRTGCWHFNDDLSAVRPSPAAAFFSDGDQKHRHLHHGLRF